MALLIDKVLNFHDNIFREWRDPRVDGWLLMDSFWGMAGIISFYLYFVLYLGPRFMKNRKPFSFDKILIVYNIFQVIYCLVIVTLFTIYVLPYYNLLCEPCDFSLDERAILVAKLTWSYFILKVIDLLDTVFIVLRKKDQQASFLHIYHHTGIALGSWGYARFIPGGSGCILGYINSIVHMVMYSYYLFSVLFSSKKGSVWWKKHITHLQLLQFCFLVFKFTGMVFMENCRFPKLLSVAAVSQNLLMLYLFGVFYFRTYITDPKKKIKI